MAMSLCDFPLERLPSRCPTALFLRLQAPPRWRRTPSWAPSNSACGTPSSAIPRIPEMGGPKWGPRGIQGCQKWIEMGSESYYQWPIKYGHIMSYMVLTYLHFRILKFPLILSYYHLWHCKFHGSDGHWCCLFFNQKLEMNCPRTAFLLQHKVLPGSPKIRAPWKPN